jgi:hypothetical protein
VSVSQSDVVTLARQGDPHAIATLINRALRSQNITAKTIRRDQHLYVILQAQELPNQSACVRVVQNGMLRLGIMTIKLVTIAGQQLNQESPSWFETLTLAEMMRSQLPYPQQAVATPQTPAKTVRKKANFQLPRVTFPPPSHSHTSVNPIYFCGLCGVSLFPVIPLDVTKLSRHHH